MTDTEPRTEAAFEAGGQQYAAGDRVRFPRAGMRRNRKCVYEITEASPGGITTEADGCRYQLSRGDIAAIGIMHADQKRGHHDR
ncbi:hypothetical protein [Streptomyces olivaceus]|uniref:hypothetical protein n=1 Tax=Streptomyces olivaceus TaxID=47716 RepID=UPI0004CAC32B|nr:hypothetical protein [Streptomyces olivaceus]MBZ6102713.1 hypothetical protein [Streptomyces olivaceus]